MPAFAYGIIVVVMGAGCAPAPQPTSTFRTPDPSLQVESTPLDTSSPAADAHWQPLSLTGTMGSGSGAGGWGTAIDDFDQDGVFDILVPGADGGWWCAPVGAGDFASNVHCAWSDLLEGRGAVAVWRGPQADLLLLRSGADALVRFPIETAELIDVPWPPGDSHHASWGDLDGDGVLEVFVPQLFDEQDLPQLNILAWGGPDGQLVPDALALPAAAGDLASYGGGFVDINGDGQLDLYPSSDKPDLGNWSVPVWNHGGALEEGPHQNLAVHITGMGMAMGDLNGDLVEDFVHAGWGELGLLLSAPDATWVRADLSQGMVVDAERVVSWGPITADLDLDGDLDVVVPFGAKRQEDGSLAPDDNPLHQRMAVYRNDRGAFVEVSAEWGLDAIGEWRSVVAADLNDDGTLDLIARRLDGPVQIWLGESLSNQAARIVLIDDTTPANPTGVGARLTMTAAGHAQVRTIRAGGEGLASSGPAEAHFGLGPAQSIDTLVIDWPDGERIELLDLPAARVVIRRLRPPAP